MVEKLATEILIRIFSYLTNQQKRECLATCQHWKHVIESTVLETRVYLTEQSIQSSFEEMTQTRTLLLDQCNLTPKQLSRLPTLFPHVEHLVLCDGDPDVLTLTTHEETSAETWSKCLKSIIESTDYMFSFHLLSKAAFTQLSHLSLAFRYSDHISQKMHFFQLLRPSPIETLELASIVLSLEEMDILHENTPHLKHLVLTDSTLIARQQRDGRGFHQAMDPTTFQLLLHQPASNICHVEFTKQCRFYQSEQYWIRYMAQKYPNLEHLSLDCLHPHLGRQLLSWTLRIRSSFMTISQLCPSFHSFFIKAVQLNREFINAWGENTLRRINWIVPDDQSTLPALSKAKQYRIEALHLGLNRLFSHASILPHLQFISKIHANLKEIHLEGFPQVHNILHILQWFPKLEILILEKIESIQFDDNHSKINGHFHLKTLSLSSCGLEDSFLESISKHCPSLCRVNVMDCPGIKDIHMPYSNLQYLELKLHDVDDNKDSDDSDDTQRDQQQQQQQQEEAYFHIKANSLENTIKYLSTRPI
ncbi:hypothetical protein K501DRAFT_336359 [Backusella circina FSU 941]|nr:hypothetical protein K501DRAFT_336359 [Backusella circina FSU 941]